VSARRKARRRALDILFSADVAEVDVAAALVAASDQAAHDPQRASSWDYAKEIVSGVIDHREEIDALLSGTSTTWPLDRMPSVDRAVLRLAVWEILHNPDVPAAVAISEAVAMAGELSTEASGGFVHGILASITETHANS
jgi:transcription antitermination protein NusB